MKAGTGVLIDGRIDEGIWTTVEPYTTFTPQ